MVDRQQKEDFYHQQLAQAAWANLRAGGAAGYSASHSGFSAPGSAPNHAPGGGGGAGGATPSTNPYQNYMMQLQQFAATGGQTPNSPVFPGASSGPGPGTAFLGANGVGLPQSFPPGHPYHGMGYGHTPLPAHSSLPTHMKPNSTTAPLPAHMRSSPYHSYYQVPGQPSFPPTSSYQSPSSGSTPRGNGLTDQATAYTQLQQIYSQAAREKKSPETTAGQPSTSNNNYPAYTYSGSTQPQPTYQTGTASSLPSSGEQPSYDQIAASLLNRFPGQFSSALMMEMNNMGQQPGQARSARPRDDEPSAQQPSQHGPSKPGLPLHIAKPPHSSSKSGSLPPQPSKSGGLPPQGARSIGLPPQSTKPGGLPPHGAKPAGLPLQGTKPGSLPLQGAKPGSLPPPGAKLGDVSIQGTKLGSLHQSHGTKPVGLPLQGHKPGGLSQQGIRPSGLPMHGSKLGGNSSQAPKLGGLPPQTAKLGGLPSQVSMLGNLSSPAAMLSGLPPHVMKPSLSQKSSKPSLPSQVQAKSSFPQHSLSKPGVPPHQATMSGLPPLATQLGFSSQALNKERTPPDPGQERRPPDPASPAMVQLGSPMQPQLGSPAQSQLGSPVQSQLGSPVPLQVGSPAQAKLGSPVQTKLGSPVQAKLESPAQAKMGSPAQAKLESPVQLPLGSPAPAQLGSPAQLQIESPLQAQLGSPAQAQMERPSQANLGETVQQHLGNPMDQAQIHPIGSASGKYKGEEHVKPQAVARLQSRDSPRLNTPPGPDSSLLTSSASESITKQREDVPTTATSPVGVPSPAPPPYSSQPVVYSPQSTPAYSGQPTVTYSVQTTAAYSPQSSAAYNVQTTAVCSAPSTAAYSAPSTVAHSVQTTTAYSVQTTAAYSAQSTAAYSVQSTTAYSAQSTTVYSAQSTAAYSVLSTAGSSAGSTVASSAQSTVAFSAQSTAAYSVQSTVTYSTQPSVTYSVQPTVSTYSVQPPHLAHSLPPGGGHSEHASRSLGYTTTSQIHSPSIQTPDTASSRPKEKLDNAQTGLKGLWKMQAEFQQGKKKIAPTPGGTPRFPNPELEQQYRKDLNGPGVISGQSPLSPHPPGGPLLLHTPRSPPHPPPRRPELPQLPPGLAIKLSSPSVPSLDQTKATKPPDLPPVVHLNQASDRMEVKNSGIPGPGAITWKRKSLEDSPTSNHVKSKKRKVQSTVIDPYSFDDDDSPDKKITRLHDENGSGFLGSGFGSSSQGPVYKYKSAMLSREQEKEEERDEGRGESDESSRSSNGGNLSPVKKKYKRPKMEEWSVAPKTSAKPGDKAERPEKTEGVAALGQGPRRGPLWGLPILPKPPQKPEKSRETARPSSTAVTTTAPTATASSSGKVDVKNVWLQAFGAGADTKPPKAKKKPAETSTSSNQHLDSKKPVKEEREEKVQKTILDIPPEVRRKVRPVFGGLIYFSPDWARAVKRHHERCRLPSSLENCQQLSPKILAGQFTPKKSYEDLARKDMTSPPDLLAMERDRIERTSPATTAASLALLSDPKLTQTSTTQEDELPGQLPSIVETILANRKKLREAAKMGRMYKNPYMKEKKPKRMSQAMKTTDSQIAYNPCLMPTPGLPMLTEDTKDVLIDQGYGDFRRYTLLRYLEPESEGKEPYVPESLESKTSRQSSMPVKSAGIIRQIFGLDPPTPVVKQKKPVVEVRTERETNGHRSPSVVPTKKEKKKEAKTPAVIKPPPAPVKSNKFKPVMGRKIDAGKDDGSYSQEVGTPTDRDNGLQTQLGGFALDLLDDNLSWAKQVTIQNLVIWEPAETPIVISKKKKGKRKKARKSGLDFSNQKKKNKSGASANGSRATSPLPGEQPHEVTYNLDNVVAESQRWVVDKNAGETILHRASKMGYPDVVAYALDMLGMGAMDKDYAGLTPLHKAAFKGHATSVRLLLKYGADPSSGVKGTRALHEAIESPSPDSVRALLCYGGDILLHNYNGQTPVDLAENSARDGDTTMRDYICNLIADLQGRTPGLRSKEIVNVKRWNVSHCRDFHDPTHPESGLLPVDLEPSPPPASVAKSESKKEDFFEFDVSNHPLPTTFQLADKPGRWVIYKDLRDFSKKTGQARTASEIKTKGELLELKKSDFLKLGHCSVLDRRDLDLRFQEKDSEEFIVLAKVDRLVRKIFDAELVLVPA